MIRLRWGILVLVVLCSRAVADEPNDTFETATVLPSGQLSVSDDLAASFFPDTILGVRDHFGEIYDSDDDSSPLGDGFASALFDVPTNSGVIDFVVTGYDDFDFTGAHGQFGEYEVYVDVYDFFGDYVDSFSEARLLEPGTTHDFYDFDFEWDGGSYDVYIDNTVGPHDVDFYEFSDLEPGAAFRARTIDPAPPSGVDTYLGWFDDMGTLLESDDDDGGGLLSLIEGIVPASGNLTFAVTGFGDYGFIGDHSQLGSYDLQLEIASVGLPGDFNHDDAVDAADYVTWRKGLDTEYTQADYETWRAHFGETVGGASSDGALIPEPASVILFSMAIAFVCGAVRRSR